MSKRSKRATATNQRPLVARSQAPAGASDAVVSAPQAQSQFMKGESSPFFFSWRPALRDSKQDVAASYTQAVARTIDAVQNSGWLSGCIEQSKGNIIGGNGLRLAFKPDASVVSGWSVKEMSDWSRMVERRFEAWSEDACECDASGKHTLGQLQEQLLDSYFTHGEVLALLPRIARPGTTTAVKVKLLPPHKLVQDTAETIGMYQGVTMGDWGFPLRYRVELATAYGLEQPVEVDAFTPDGDQQVIHVFRGTPGQVRGITPFVHALRIIKQYDQLSDATLQKALIDAIFAATMESPSPTNDILQALQDEGEQGIGAGSMSDYLSSKAAWYENTKIDLGRGGRIAHLFPGEKLALTTSTRISGDYEAFSKFLLREIARCMGLSFEAMTGDYSGATYSSVRMSSSELWPLTVSRRKHIVARVLQDIFMAWLDEEILTGRVPFKGGPAAYFASRKALCRTDWRGPPKPQADDLKAAKAMEVLKNLGIASDEQLCADLGTDYEDVYEQRAREKQMREDLDLPDGFTLAPDPVGDALAVEGDSAPPPRKGK